MSTTTIEQPQVIAPAEPLTEAEVDSLVLSAESVQKRRTVKGGVGTVRQPRAWSVYGVD